MSGTGKYVAAIDQGTTGTRFIVFERGGTIRASAYREHRQIYPQPGWVEHDALEIWDKTREVIRETLTSGKVSAGEIAALGITNQRETTILWERRTGKPVCNAIVWQDTRTRDLCLSLQKQKLEPQVKKKTGLVISTYFSAPKIAWMLDSDERLKARAKNGDILFGTIDSWLIWNLTGGAEGGRHVTDYTNASRTMLMDLESLSWDDDLTGAMGVYSSMLPEIRPSVDADFYGLTKKTGPFGAEIPVCGCLGDQQAALFGQACFEVGEAKNTYGTGCFLLSNTGNQPVASAFGLLTTVAYGMKPGSATYALEGSLAVTGAAVQWLRDNLKIIKSADETEALAKAVEDAGGMYFVPAFSGLFAPYWDMNARGTMTGMTRYITREHIVRATLESICYQSRDVIDAMNRDTGKGIKILKVDGGAVRNNFLLSFQADILGIPCVRPKVQETTALGAAYAAGLAAGFYENTGDLRKNWHEDRTFYPLIDDDRREELYGGWKKAVGKSRDWVE